MSTMRDRLGGHATKVGEELQEMGAVVQDAAQEKLEQLREEGSQYYEQGRNKVHGVACACEQFVRDRPLRSVVMAVGIGWVLGRFWKR